MMDKYERCISSSSIQMEYLLLQIKFVINVLTMKLRRIVSDYMLTIPSFINLFFNMSYLLRLYVACLLFHLLTNELIIIQWIYD